MFRCDVVAVGNMTGAAHGGVCMFGVPQATPD